MRNFYVTSIFRVLGGPCLLLAAFISLSFPVSDAKSDPPLPLPLTQFTLTTSVFPEGTGIVTPPGTTWQNADEVVLVSATPNPGYQLGYWVGDLSGSLNPSMITMTGPKAVTAVFVPVETVSTPSTPSGPTRGFPNIAYTYTAGVSTSNLGHPVQYRFALPDGTYTLWSVSRNVDVSWPSPGTYALRAQARCEADHSVVSPLSNALTIAIEPPDNYPLIGFLESPANGQTYSGISTIYGWGLDLKGIAKVQLSIDGQFIAEIPYGGPRADVEAAYPNYPNSLRSGFAMVWNYSILPEGMHPMIVRLHNQDGQTLDLKATFHVKRFHGEYVNQVAPGTDWLYDKSVTADGVPRLYDIQIEWSEAIQGFQIIDIVPK